MFYLLNLGRLIKLLILGITDVVTGGILTPLNFDTFGFVLIDFMIYFLYTCVPTPNILGIPTVKIACTP